CLLSGGASRRMGRDKALLPHPAGGTWLEHTLRQLAVLEVPISLLSRHPEHRTRARELALAQLDCLDEPPPWEGPLLALQRLMAHHPEQRLLLCPVDLPHLKAPVLLQLQALATAEPAALHLAHDGERLQPLLGVYPSDLARRTSLSAAVDAGERRLQSWLAGQPCRIHRLDPLALRNINRPEDLPPWPTNPNGSA
ncbi:MAG: molybdenum cofactor guanylyltransferase, partial [Vulcanococcus sp.]